MSTKYFSTTEAAEVLGVTPRLVNRFCGEGRLGRKIGRNWAITERDLQRFAAIPRTTGHPFTVNKPHATPPPEETSDSDAGA